MLVYKDIYNTKGRDGIKEEIAKLLKEGNQHRLAQLLSWWSPIQNQIVEEENEAKGLNNYHGFLDDKNEMEKGRIKKTLKKPRLRTIGGETKGYTRKEYIEIMIAEGWEFDSGKFTGQKEMKDGTLKLVDIDGFLIAKENESYEITKTEYDYGRYLTKAQ